MQSSTTKRYRPNRMML